MVKNNDYMGYRFSASDLSCFFRIHAEFAETQVVVM